MLEDPDESVVELKEDETYKEEKRSALHNLKTVSWLKKHKRKNTRKMSEYDDPGKHYSLMLF